MLDLGDGTNKVIEIISTIRRAHTFTREIVESSFNIVEPWYTFPDKAILDAIAQTGAKKSVTELVASYISSQSQFKGEKTKSWTYKGMGFFQGDVLSSNL